MPVADEHLPLAEPLAERRRHDVELVVVVPRWEGFSTWRDVGATTKTCFAKRLSCGSETLLSACQAIAIAITTVAAAGRQLDAEPRERPAAAPDVDARRSAAGASTLQISVSIASSWQKKKRCPSPRDGSRQMSRFVVPETPGHPAALQAATRSRMRFTSGSSTKIPGSSKESWPGVAIT